MLGKPIERTETLAKSYVGQRVDKALAEIWLEFSRAQITNWMRVGAIRINGEVVKPNVKVCGGEKVRLRAVMSRPEDWLTPEVVDFSVVYEDQDFLIVDKPKGLVVHPGAGNLNGTLVNGLIERRAELAQLPRAGIVHRLDKDTTGLMVVAGNNKALKLLTRAIAKHEVDRRYVSICEGILLKQERLEMSIGRDLEIGRGSACERMGELPSRVSGRSRRSGRTRWSKRFWKREEPIKCVFTWPRLVTRWSEIVATARAGAYPSNRPKS